LTTAIATLVPRVTQGTATGFLRTHVVPAYRRAGHPVRAVLTGDGPEFYGRFLTACRDLGIEHRPTKPRHAWTNGFVERLQGTILSELWRVAFRRTYYTHVGQLERDLQRLPAVLQPGPTASRVPVARPDAGDRVHRQEGQLTHAASFGWSAKVSTPHPYWTA
jgi:transposase InsO family protein